MPNVRRMGKELLHRCGIEVGRYLPYDIDERTKATFKAVAPYTMTSPERVFALCNAIRYVVSNAVPGAYVECGVWRGGSSMAAAMTLLEMGDVSRQLFLFDTFEGMVAPTAHDRRFDQVSASELLAKQDPQSQRSLWANVPLEDVKAAMLSVGYPSGRINYVKGPVESTIPDRAPDAIAVLRLDTDWYESTRHELEHLYPRIVNGGVILIDDYGAWQGARKAVDEFFGASRIPILLNRIDNTGRIAIVVSGGS